MSYPPVPPLLDPYQVKPQDSHDRKFIEYVYTLQKNAVNQNEALFQKILGGMGDLGQWKSEYNGSHHRRLITKFIEQYSPEHEYQPALILYPRVLRVFSQSEVEMSISMVMRFERGFIDGPQQIDALRDLNFQSVVDYFEKATSIPRKIELEHEEYPGNLLGGSNYSQVPDYRRLSLENPLIEQANRVMVNNDFEPFNFDLFRKDVLYIASEEKKILNRFYDGLYLAADGGVVPNEEVIYCYRILADAFEHFVRALGQKQPKLQKLLDRFDAENPIDLTRRQKKERVSALLDLFEKIIAKNEQSSMFEKLGHLIVVIRMLMSELDKKYDKVADKAIRNKTRDLKERIINGSEKEFQYSLLHPGEIFGPDVFNDEEWTRKHARTVINNLLELPEFIHVPADESDEGPVFVAHMPLLYRMEAEAMHRDDREKLAVVRRLIAAAPNLRPDAGPYRGQLKQHNEKLYKEAEKLMATLNQAQGRAKREAEEQKKQADRMIAASAGSVAAILAVGLYAGLAEFSALPAFVLGGMAFGIAYALAGTVQNAVRGGRNKAATDAPAGDSGENPSVTKDLDALFPRNAKDPMAVVYTTNKLTAAILKLDRIKKLKDEAKTTAAAELETAAGSRAALIKIPGDKVPINYSEAVYVGRRALKSDGDRKKISAHFRTEAEKARRHKQFNQKIVDYYSFIADEIDFNHARLAGQG